MSARRLLRILVKHLRVVSRRIIGLVLLSSPCHSLPLEIGYRRLFFQVDGITPELRNKLKKLRRVFFAMGPSFLSISYFILDGPAALLLGRSERTSSNSFSEISSSILLYHSSCIS